MLVAILNQTTSLLARNQPSWQRGGRRAHAMPPSLRTKRILLALIALSIIIFSCRIRSEWLTQPANDSLLSRSSISPIDGSASASPPTSMQPFPSSSPPPSLAPFAAYLRKNRMRRVRLMHDNATLGRPNDGPVISGRSPHSPRIASRDQTCSTCRFLHWNILDGGGSRLDGICAFLRTGQFDVVTLNELNGFDEGSLAKFAERCGYAHSRLLAKSAYHLGVISRHPLKLIVAERSSIFSHGMLCVQVLGISLCVTHLNPHNARKRAAEARSIARRVAANGPRPFMLMGDLNTLSSIDRVAHSAANLPTKINSGPYAKQLRNKFLSRMHAAHDADALHARRTLMRHNLIHEVPLHASV